MKRIEEYVILKWAGWDELDDGMQFENCKLNPDFFTPEQMQEFEEALEAEDTNDITVSIQWAESGSVIGVYIGEQYWDFQYGLVNLGRIES
ncbi:hypothetical protein [Kosakonia phage Kc304]|uniref:Uncharacterized protein n=2 Tax=Winklervirus chi14 TaxID=2560752 RepID=A0A1Z1LY70_9CAUD|nr:hypothetical protein FDI23_gp068 [Serratia phage CHI14]ARW57491.1 hypothetical protein [Serratia phage CHI14]ARW57766.1 hypothetical protein [Serratia phage CBH8]QYN80510.1 hypothetical protein [Kosakonia phage Kc304]